MLPTLVIRPTSIQAAMGSVSVISATLELVLSTSQYPKSLNHNPLSPSVAEPGPSCLELQVSGLRVSGF